MSQVASPLNSTRTFRHNPTTEKMYVTPLGDLRCANEESWRLDLFLVRSHLANTPQQTNLDYDEVSLSAIDARSHTAPITSFNQPSYTGVTDVATREDPNARPFSSYMLRDNDGGRHGLRLSGKEENMSMGKVMFLEAEVKRLRDALEKATSERSSSIDGGRDRGNTFVASSSRARRNDPIYLTQRPLQPQIQLSGNAGSLLDSSGTPIDTTDTAAFMRHGLSDVAFTPSSLAGPDMPLNSTEAFTPYGIVPQSLGTMGNPQAYVARQYHLPRLS